MAFLISFIFLSSWIAVAITLPHNAYVKGSRMDFESSGSGPDEPVQGIVKVVQLTHSGFFRRGLTPRRAHSNRLPFPSFLSHGHLGQVGAHNAPINPLHTLRPKNPTELELKKKQGLQMWQNVIGKGGKMSLPVNLKDMKQTCNAVPFTQHVTADGCETVTVYNKLCFGQCSSLFVPSEGEFAGLSPGTGALHRRAPCSRCAPSKAQTVTLPLRCGANVQEKQVMVVEECKCETSHEERSAVPAGYTHI